MKTCEIKVYKLQNNLCDDNRHQANWSHETINKQWPSEMKFSISFIFDKDETLVSDAEDCERNAN